MYKTKFLKSLKKNYKPCEKLTDTMRSPTCNFPSLSVAPPSVILDMKIVWKRNETLINQQGLPPKVFEFPTYILQCSYSLMSLLQLN